jgi:streptogramin lyase
MGVSLSPSDVHYPASGPGVLGWSSNNRGGVFASGTPTQPPLDVSAFPAARLVAQLHLVPVETDGRPPLVGLAGDLFVMLEPSTGLATMWLCQRGSTATLEAQWVRLQTAPDYAPAHRRGAMTEFPLPQPNSNPAYITAGPDGNLWFTEFQNLNVGRIGRITPEGRLTEYTLPTPNSAAGFISAGPDGNLWFTEYQSNCIGRITPEGEITEYTLPSPNSYPGPIVTGPDGNLWFTEINQIGRITPRGDITEFPIAAPFGAPFGITSGPDGNLWFTWADVRPEVNDVGRITPAGEITWFPGVPGDRTGGLGAQVGGITVGPDGNLWFPLVTLGAFAPSGNTGSIVCMSLSGDLLMRYPIVEGVDQTPMTPGPDGNLWFPRGDFQIGIMTPGGTVTQFSLPRPLNFNGMAAGPDGNIWVTDRIQNQIVRLTL